MKEINDFYYPIKIGAEQDGFFCCLCTDAEYHDKAELSGHTHFIKKNNRWFYLRNLNNATIST